MSNFATLVLVADSSQMKSAETAIDGMTDAGRRAEGATKKSAKGMSDAYSALSANVAKAAAKMVIALGSVAGTLASGKMFSAAIRESEQLERNLFRTGAIIQATGGAANRTVAQLHGQARALARETLQSTEGVMRAQQTLLTFRKVQGGVFDDAIKAAADMSAALGTDLNSNVLQLGKALEDPITGLTALTRSGTVFTEAQKEMVRQMVETGRVADAQKFILAELAAQYGGVAAQEASGLAGAQDSLAQSAQEFLIRLSDVLGLLPAATAFYNKLAGAVDFAATQIERVAFYLGAGAAALTVAFAPAIVSATIAVGGFVASLVLTRAALLRTGIGALVIGAGELAYQFYRLVTATGGWGNALSLLGEVASGVWEGIKTSASAIKPALGAIWADVSAAFTRMLQTMSLNWGNFLWRLGSGVEAIPGFGDVAQSLKNASDTAIDKFVELDAAASGMEGSAIRLRGEAANLATQGFDKAKEAAGKLSAAVSGAAESTEDGAEAADRLASALGDDPTGGGGATKKMKEAKKAADEMADAMKGHVSGAVDTLAGAFGDFLTGSISSFKDFTKTIIDGFKRMISQMIATAIANPIKIALGLTGSVGGSAAAAAVSGGGGAGGAGSGLLGGLLGSGGLFASIGSGAMGLATSLFGAGGGIAAAGTYLKAVIGSATTSIGGFGAAVGALALPLLAVGGVIGLIVKGLSQKYAGTALRGNLGAGGFQGTSFDFYKGGFLRGDRADYSDVPDDLQALLDDSMTGISTSIRSMAADLDLGAKKIDGFLGEEFTIWTNGKTEEEIQKALTEQITKSGDAMADLVLGTDAWSRAGEGSLATLTRLSTGLNAVNDAADLLGHRIWAVSLASADAASELVDLFGGLENMTAAVGTYWQAFYSDAERTETTIRRLSEEFADLGIAMPQSRDAFRALVEGIDTTTTGGRELYAQLIGLAGAMDQVLPKVAEFTLGMQGLLDQIGGEIGAMIEAARVNVSDATEAARLWYRTAQTLRDFIRDLTNSPLSAASPAQQFAVNRNRFNAAFEMVKGGDQQAAADMPALAKAYLESLKATSRSSTEYRRAASQVLGQVNFAAGISELEGANDDVLRGLYEKQIEVLTSLGNFLQLEGITGADLEKLTPAIRKMVKDWDGTVGQFKGTLRGLDRAITKAQNFSYSKVLADLDIAIKLGAVKGAPEWLQRMAKKAGTDIRTTLDFIIRRNDLTPPMRWIAVNSVSEHVKTLDFVIGSDLLPRDKRLALETSSALRRSLRFIVAADLPDDLKTIALAGNSDLTRTVSAALKMAKTPRDAQALRLALGNVGAYTAHVDAVLVTKGMGPRVKRIVLEQQGSYAAMIEAAVTELKGPGRRILLTQQGEYIANIGAIIAVTGRRRALLMEDVTEGDRTITTGMEFAKGIGDRKAALLLQANTVGARAITLLAAFSDGMPDWKKDLLKGVGGRVDRIIDAHVNGKPIPPGGWLFLNRLAGGRVNRSIDAHVNGKPITNYGWLFLNRLAGGAVDRTINAFVNDGGLTDQQKTLIKAITGASAGKITLGGSFTFTPAEAFKVYFGEFSKDATKVSSLSGSMSKLGAMLDALRLAVVADTADRKAALVAAQIATLQSSGLDLISSRVGDAQDILKRRNALMSSYGVSAVAGHDYTVGAKGQINGDGWMQGTVAALTALKSTEAWKALNAEQVSHNSTWVAVAALRAQIRDLGATPAFAGGGLHTGGMARIGENDMELVAPSRIYSPSETRSMLDNRAVVAELRRLNSEVSKLRDEQRQLGLQTASHTKKTADLSKKWDVVGQPVRNPDDGTALEVI